MISSCVTRHVDRLFRRDENAADAGYEAAAPDFAARFQAPKHLEKIAPWRRERLTGKQISKNHAPAQQQLIGEGFARCRWRSRRELQQRPPASGVPWPRVPAPAFSAAALGIDQRAEVLESIGGD